MSQVDTAQISRQETLKFLRQNLNSALLGKEDQVELVIACLLARGHMLLDDLPGTGKTSLARALADSLGGSFARVQCTPDLLPSDVTGFNLFNQKTREFEFHQGPVFSDILLADELNRTTPRTQSALLEAMAERQVTIDGIARRLSPTFFVIATQNPIDSQGAYPLPEAQLDRFAIQLAIGYPDRQSQLAILERACKPTTTNRNDSGSRDGDNGSGGGGSGGSGSSDGENATDESKALSLDELAAMQEHVMQIAVHTKVRGYLVDLVEATRSHPSIVLGVSPRGMLYWQRMAQAWAFLQNRDYVTPSDVHHVAKPVVQVRIQTQIEQPDVVIQKILDQTDVPEYE